MMWTVLNTIKWLTDYLDKKGVPEARLNAEQLISHILKIKRLELYLQFERVLTKAELADLKPLIERRAKREPLQYIIGSQPFRNVDVKVNKNVLIPRPETEIVVGEALKHIPPDSEMKILELGVGSGAIAASLASERASVAITGTEISAAALAVAKENTFAYKDRINLLHGNLYEPVKELKFDLIISNPPYCPAPDWERLQPEVRDYEPKEALVAGEDGLDFYRKIINDAHNYLCPNGQLTLEVGDGQSEAVSSLITKTGMYNNVSVKKDLNHKDRVILCNLNTP